jgi:hypothetical protein
MFTALPGNSQKNGQRGGLRAPKGPSEQEL